MISSSTLITPQSAFPLNQPKDRSRLKIDGESVIGYLKTSSSLVCMHRRDQIIHRQVEVLSS